MMKHWNFLSSISLIVAVLFLVSVSVCPAMGHVVNEPAGSCPTCSGGAYDLSKLPGFENKTVPTLNIEEISHTAGIKKSSGKAAGTATTVEGKQKRNINSAIQFDIQDPRLRQQTGGYQTDSLADVTRSPPVSDERITAMIANMSIAGYDLAVMTSHRYKDSMNTQDYLGLNSSQKQALAANGITLTSGTTSESFKDVDLYTFTNRATKTQTYVMAVQQLDSNKNPIGRLVLIGSPEFNASGISVKSASFSAPASERTCFWNWFSVGLLTVSLGVNIAIIATGTGGTALPSAFAAIGLCGNILVTRGHVFIPPIGTELPGTNPVSAYSFTGAFITLAIISLILTLILLAYAIYELGVCEGWWGNEIVWIYQYRFAEAENGKMVSMYPNDRFVVDLYSDNRIDKNAHWEIVSSSGLSVVGEQRTSTNNETFQSWLVHAQGTGQKEFALRLVSSAPASAIGTKYSLSLSVEKGEYKITTIDKTFNAQGLGRAVSVAIDPSGMPHVSYYDAAGMQIKYGSLVNGVWNVEAVAASHGTYTTSLAFDKQGNPAISYGDGFTFGNMMFAHKTGSGWTSVKVDNGGGLGNVGQYSSLVIDNNGIAHISYNDGKKTAADIMYAVQEGAGWKIVKVTTLDAGYESSLVLDIKDLAHIAYSHYMSTHPSLFYTKQDGKGNWDGLGTLVDNGGGTFSETGYEPSIALDPSGNPHISYYDKSKGDLRYASFDGKTWSSETVDGTGTVGQFSSLAIDDHGNAFISYYHASGEKLRLATWMTGTQKWVLRTIDTGGVGEYSSLAIDLTGHPCIAYFDATNNALKYAGWVE